MRKQSPTTVFSPVRFKVEIDHHDPAAVRELSRLVEQSNLEGTKLSAAPPIVRVPLMSAPNPDPGA